MSRRGQCLDNAIAESFFHSLKTERAILTRDAYSLDVTGRRLGITEHTGRNNTYTYDDVYRLTQ